MIPKIMIPKIMRQNLDFSKYGRAISQNQYPIEVSAGSDYTKNSMLHLKNLSDTTRGEGGHGP